MLPAAFLASFLACSSESASIEGRTYTPNEYETTLGQLHTETFYESEDLALPFVLAAVDGHIVVGDPYSAPHFHVISRADGSLVRRFGQAGAGPGEYEFPSAILPELVRDTLWIGDPGNGRITGIAWRDIVGSEDLPKPRTIPFRLPFREVLAGPDDNFLVVDASGLSQFVTVSPEGRIQSRLGRTTESDLPPAIAGLAYLDWMASHPSGEVVAAAGAWAGSVNILEAATGAVVGSADVPIKFGPDLGWSQGPNGLSLRPNERSRQGYVDVVATHNHIFGLFSGRRILEYGTSAQQAEDLHVFDWDGRVVALYRLDTPVVSLAYEEGSGMFYAIRLEESPAILRFSVDESKPATLR